MRPSNSHEGGDKRRARGGPTRWSFPALATVGPGVSGSRSQLRKTSRVAATSSSDRGAIRRASSAQAASQTPHPVQARASIATISSSPAPLVSLSTSRKKGSVTDSGRAAVPSAIARKARSKAGSSSSGTFI